MQLTDPDVPEFIQTAAAAMHAADCGCESENFCNDEDSEAYYLMHARAAAPHLLLAGYADGRDDAADDITTYAHARMKDPGIRAHWAHAAHIAREGLQGRICPPASGNS